MPGPFQGISTASTALRAFQRALDVTGHNIANVNTPGYSRQRVEFGTFEPTLFFQGGAHALGNGVNIESINRIRDLFLEARRLAAGGDLGQSHAALDGMKQIEKLFLEPGGSGVADALDKFFNAWSGLATNPAERGNRVQVQMAGKTLADRIRGAWSNLDQLRSQTETQIDQTFRDIDSLTSRIDALNKEIRHQSASGAQPNDLLDERNAAIRDLSKLVDIRTHTFDDGSVAIYTNSLTLVDAGGASPIWRNYNLSTNSLVDGSRSVPVTGGTLGGLFTSLQKTLGAQKNLDDLANGLRAQVNALHLPGRTANGSTGINFFNANTQDPPELGASTFALSAQVQSDADFIAAGTSGAAGDNGVALALSALRNAPTMSSNRTFSKFFSDFATDVGRDVVYAKSAFETHDAVVKQIDQQIESVSGVNLDDEMANMMRFQRSYQAAAKALSTFDQVTEDLINMLRR